MSKKRKGGIDRIREIGGFLDNGAHVSGATVIKPDGGSEMVTKKITGKKKRKRTSPMSRKGSSVQNPVLIQPKVITLTKTHRIPLKADKKKPNGNVLFKAALEQIAEQFFKEGKQENASVTSKVADYMLREHAGAAFDDPERKKKKRDTQVDCNYVIPKLFIVVNNGGDHIQCNYNKTVYQRKYMQDSLNKECYVNMLRHRDQFDGKGIHGFMYGLMVGCNMTIKVKRDTESFELPFADPKYLSALLEKTPPEKRPDDQSGTWNVDVEESEKRAKFARYFSNFSEFPDKIGTPKIITYDGEQIVGPTHHNLIIAKNLKTIATIAACFQQKNGRQVQIITSDTFVNPFPDVYVLFPHSEEDRIHNNDDNNLNRLFDEVTDLSVCSAASRVAKRTNSNWIPPNNFSLESAYGAWKLGLVQ